MVGRLSYGVSGDVIWMGFCVILFMSPSDGLNILFFGGAQMDYSD